MKFITTDLKDAYIIEPDLLKDDRGFFARSFCVNEFGKMNLDTEIVQCNISYNRLKGTVRGMHFQKKPYEETKLVRCTAGSIYDVIVDLRASSKTYLKWIAVKLSADNRKMLYVPAGFAHGFQTLQDDTEVFYHMFNFYNADYAAGFNFKDKKLNIDWPLPVTAISEKDKNLPELL